MLENPAIFDQLLKVMGVGLRDDEVHESSPVGRTAGGDRRVLRRADNDGKLSDDGREWFDPPFVNEIRFFFTRKGIRHPHRLFHTVLEEECSGNLDEVLSK